MSETNKLIEENVIRKTSEPIAPMTRSKKNAVWTRPWRKAMCDEDSDSYTGTKTTCSTSSCTVKLAQGCVAVFKDVAVNSVEALTTALPRQLVSVVIRGDSVLFQLYFGGTQFWCGRKLDHGVFTDVA